jgi:hypothetical protein
MGQAGHDDPVQIVDDVREWLRVGGRVRRQLLPDVAGLGARHHRSRTNRCAVVGNPVDDLVAGYPKFFWCHPGDSMAIVFTAKLAKRRTIVVVRG